MSSSSTKRIRIAWVPISVRRPRTRMHQVGSGMDRGEVGHPDVLEDAQHGELALLVDQGVVGEDREVEPKGHATRIDSMTSFFWIALTMSRPVVTWPKTVWTRSR